MTERASRWTWAWVGALVLIMFGPNLSHLDTAALGGADTDALKHVWTQWWVVMRVLQDGAIPFEATLIQHPGGGPFFALDTVNALLGLPFRAVSGPVATYNLMLIVDLMLGAWAAMALARAIGATPWSSTLAGVGWALSAWVLAFPLASGVSETAFFFPLPLILLLGLRTVQRTGWGAPAGMAALLALQGLGCWSHGITASVALAFVGAVWLLRKPWRWPAGTVGRLDRHTAQRLALAGVVLLILILPAYLAISGTVHDADAVKTRHLALFPDSPISPLDVMEANGLAVVDFFLPGRWGLRESAVGPERLMYAGYLGWTMIALAIFALRRGERNDRLIGAGALLFLILALGPRVFVDHARTGAGIPNPVYLVFYFVFPLFNATIHSADRLVMGGQLGVALLAARGWTIWLGSRPPSRPVMQSLGVAALIVLESMWVSPGPWPVPMVVATQHSSAQAIAERPGSGAVLDLPFLAASTGGSGSRFVGDIFLQQTAHRRPVPFQLEGMGDESLSAATRANPFYQSMARALRTGRTPTDCDGAKGLAHLGFDHVIWRTKLVNAQHETALRAHLAGCLGEGEVFGDRVLFRVMD